MPENTEYCVGFRHWTGESKNITDIRVDGAELEAMAVEHSGPKRLFVNMKTFESRLESLIGNKLQVIFEHGHSRGPESTHRLALERCIIDFSFGASRAWQR